MTQPPAERPPTPPAEPRWEQPPSEAEAFAVPAQEPRGFITQHAFRVAPALLGLPLATPASRAIAIGVDLALVAMLSRTGGVMLAAEAAVFAFGWLRSRYHPSTRLGRGLSMPAQLLVAVLIFALTVSVLQPLWNHVFPDDDSPQASADSLDLGTGESLGLAGSLAALQACGDAGCRQASMRGMASVLGASASSRDHSIKLLDESIDDATDDAAERQQLRELSAATFDEVHGKRKAADDNAEPTASKPAASASKPVDEEDYSLLHKLLTALDDLGLSFGWAAVYFTVFTTLWAGQTPGKRLMRIRVVHLSGKPLSYWASFGRYGGYAAGLTTGLLGFLQVYWDPNRQAVQDQLSFTAVIRDAPATPQRPVA